MAERARATRTLTSTVTFLHTLHRTSETSDGPLRLGPFSRPTSSPHGAPRGRGATGAAYRKYRLEGPAFAPFRRRVARAARHRSTVHQRVSRRHADSRLYRRLLFRRFTTHRDHKTRGGRLVARLPPPPPVSRSRSVRGGGGGAWRGRRDAREQPPRMGHAARVQCEEKHREERERACLMGGAQVDGYAVDQGRDSQAHLSPCG